MSDIQPGWAIHMPHRGSDVEHWLVHWRNRFGDENDHSLEWHVVDDMLEQYRNLADTGTMLTHFSTPPRYRTHNDDGQWHRVPFPFAVFVDEQALFTEMYGRVDCELCEERFKITDEVAEMYAPGEARESKIVHAQCGLNAGMVIA